MATVNGTFENDLLNGTSGGDKISGDHGTDRIVTGDGADYVYGEGNLDPRNYKGVYENGQSDYPKYNFTYTNNSTDVLHIYWVNYLGGPIRIKSLEPGEKWTEQIAYDESRMYGAADGTVMYGVAHRPKNPDSASPTQPAVTSLTVSEFDDTVVGGVDRDVVYGQMGNDGIQGGAGNDYLRGGSGDDNLNGNIGDDNLDGGSGNDNIDGSYGNDVIAGGTGDDKITDGDGRNTIDGGTGNDLIIGGNGTDIITGGSGDDYISGGRSDDYLVGGIGNDEILGASGEDIISSGRGNDTINAGGGNDRISSGDGIDTIIGGGGNDRIRAGTGNDIVGGDNGDDEIVGGQGNDIINGGAGNDLIFGYENSPTNGAAYTIDPTENYTEWQGGSDTTSLDSSFYTFANGNSFVLGAFRAVDGRFQILKLEDDGSLVRTDYMFMKQTTRPSAAPWENLTEYGHVWTMSDGDITSTIEQDSTVSTSSFGNAIMQPEVIELPDGKVVLALTSQNGAGISLWDFNDQGQIDYITAKTFGSSQAVGDGGLLVDTTTYVSPSGSVFLFTSRAQNQFISTTKYNPADGSFVELKSQELDISPELDSGPYSMDTFTMDGQAYMIASASNGFTTYSINDSTGTLTEISTVTSPLTSGVSAADHLVTPDGSIFIAYSTPYSEGVEIYKVEAGGVVNSTPTDYILGNGDFQNANISYYTDPDVGQVPAILLNSIEANTTTIVTIDNNGSAVIQSVLSDFSNNGRSAPFLMESPDGTLFAVDGAGSIGDERELLGVRTVELEVTKKVLTVDDDVIHGGVGDDRVFGGTGNDSLYGDQGVDILNGGQGNDTFYDLDAGETASGGDDRDTFILGKGTDGGTGTITIDGGTGSTADGDVNDYDVVTWDTTVWSVVPRSFSATWDADRDTAESRSGTIQITDGTDIITVNFSEIEEIICFARGTLIKTMKGELPVEDLKAGDMVLTKDAGYQEIRWINGRVVPAAMLEANPALYPIKIAKGALGENYPSSDLYVSPQHRVLVNWELAQEMFGEPEVLIAAKKLLGMNGVEVVTQIDEVEYFHFLFDEHQIVYSNGAETESLFTGPEALKAVGQEARDELMTLFPELALTQSTPVPARTIPTGKVATRFAKSISERAKN